MRLLFPKWFVIGLSFLAVVFVLQENIYLFALDKAHYTDPNNNEKDGRSVQIQASAYPLLPGFPINISTWLERSSPTIADIDNDGDNELLIGDFNGRIHAFTAAGNNLAGYPLPGYGPIYGHLALADLDKSKKLEIIAGIGSVFVPVSCKIYQEGEKS